MDQSEFRFGIGLDVKSRARREALEDRVDNFGKVGPKPDVHPVTTKYETVPRHVGVGPLTGANRPFATRQFVLRICVDRRGSAWMGIHTAILNKRRDSTTCQTKKSLLTILRVQS